MSKQVFSFLFSICLLGLMASCNNQIEPRYPIEQKSGTFLKESIDINIQRNQEEEAYIKEIIQRDTLQKYQASKSGFWYTYSTQDTLSTENPEYGDRVVFTYNLSDIEGNELLSKEDIGQQTYYIDQNKQDLISGIREALKLMHEGETITFLFPSYKAYGYYGFQDYIGPNTPLRCTITLNTIDKSKNQL